MKREAVKTIAIIFLAAMLVLTFFSNTIMNMHLPEVETETIGYGQIKTQVRGSGTVMALDNYSVTYPNTREIVKVNVRSGDSVQRGDVLFVLAEGDSAEVEAAREAYDNIKYEYDKMMLTSASAGSFAEQLREIERLEADLAEAKEKLAVLGTDLKVNEDAVAVVEAEIKAINAKIKDVNKRISAKNKEISSLEAEKNAIGYTPTEDEVLTGKQSDVTYDAYVLAADSLELAEKNAEDAEEALDKAKKEKDSIDKELAELPDTSRVEALENEIKQSDRNIEELERNLKYVKQDFYEATENFDLEKLYDDFKDKQKDFKKAKEKYDNMDDDISDSEKERITNEYERASEAVDEAYDLYQACLTDEKNAATAEEKALSEAETTLMYALEDNTKLKKEYAELKADYEKAKALEVKVKEAEEAVKVAEDVYENAVEVLEETKKSTDKTRNGYKHAKILEYEAQIELKESELDTLEAELEGYNEQLEDKNDELSELKGEYFEDEDTVKESIKSLERQIANAKEQLEDDKANASDDEKLQALEIERMSKNVDKAKAELEKLESEAVAAEVVSPVSGTVDQIFVTAGTETTPDSPLAEISLSDQGYKMTMSVSLEQAAKLRPGMQAEVNSYYRDGITVILDSIKNDTANPGSRQKILEFSVICDESVTSIRNGSSLNITIGDKNASYESTVPNSAIFEDGNGKYILVVDSKSTAISTRYTARRVPVTVVAQDDVRSAITGNFSQSAFVVATSSEPIKDGEQVKLADD